MEKSPGYFVSWLAPFRIQLITPDARLILSLRDPVDRLLSDFSQLLEVNSKMLFKRPLPGPPWTWSEKDNRTVKDFFTQQYFRANTGTLRLNKKALIIGNYVERLRTWRALFSSHQMLVVCAEELVTHPSKVLREMVTFLNLSDFDWESHLKFSSKKGFFCIVSSRHGEERRASGSREIVENLKCLGRTKGRPHVVPPRGQLEKLMAYYQTTNEGIFKLLGKRCPWPTMGT